MPAQKRHMLDCNDTRIFVAGYGYVNFGHMVQVLNLKFYSDSIWIALDLVLRCNFGTVTLNMPFLRLAFTLSWSTRLGNEKLRANSPTLRSDTQ